MNLGRCLPQMWGFRVGRCKNLRNIQNKELLCHSPEWTHRTCAPVQVRIPAVLSRRAQDRWRPFALQAQGDINFFLWKSDASCASAGSLLDQTQFFCPFDSRPAAIDIE